MRDIDDSKAPLLDHLIELRQRLLYCVIALIVAFGICFAFASDIFAFLVQPLVKAKASQLIYTKLYEAFFVEIKVALFAAFLIAFPIIANQLWLFIAPGLYRSEKRAFLPFLIATPVLFTMGAALAYYVVMPTVFTFLLGFQTTDAGIPQQALPAMDDYLSFVMGLIFAFGFCFLLPVLLMLLARAGIVDVAQLRAFRRYAIVGAFVVAAVLTPPDVISQLLLAIPLMVLYEAGIIGIVLTDRRAARMKSAEEAGDAAE
ncbi:twin-arginine translocase subunit TatC [Sphingosinicella sp.]|jgi:sec-independent protein translocase protein TatC|uniref:twin-arginine translocase subunit TatC n=1 Tax=Sphingosinicella sp. TaxID=1917971 RepID=UPI0017A8EA34|nr:twin-arginine translocase subunit TatC [Sphingosinicella sp.]MBA4756926.1 twin-arginine translocase subunit TatC [Sphingosinicella sp.]MEA3538156.1 twin-arginine translocase subunit TatC [Pseudomonadota bacterium]